MTPLLLRERALSGEADSQSLLVTREPLKLEVFSEGSLELVLLENVSPLVRGILQRALVQQLDHLTHSVLKGPLRPEEEHVTVPIWLLLPDEAVKRHPQEIFCGLYFEHNHVR